MPDLSQDPIINIVHNGIKTGIRVALQNRCLGAAVVLIYSGIDTMAYLNMPAGQEDVRKKDFVDWAERYIRFPCKEQLSGLDLYGARCAMLHNYGTASRLSRQGKCRQVEYCDKSVPEVIYEPRKRKDLVMVSIQALAQVFLSRVDKFLIDLFSDRQKRTVAEGRFRNLVRAVPYDHPKPSDPRR